MIIRRLAETDKSAKIFCRRNLRPNDIYPNAFIPTTFYFNLLCILNFLFVVILVMPELWPVLVIYDHNDSGQYYRTTIVVKAILS